MATYSFLIGTFLILSVWILCVSAKSTCPPAKVLEPCFCDQALDPTVLCSNLTRMELINEIFSKSGDYRFKWFFLENSTLMFLPAQSLVSKRFYGLMIKNTRLIGLFDTVPSSSNTIAVFSLQNVVIQRGIKWEHFQKMVKLVHIQFINMNMKTVGKEFPNNMNPGLTHITMMHTKTTKLADGAFVGLKEIQSVVITNNRLKVLKRNFFDKPSNIRSLSFNDNLLESLPDDMFAEMPLLRSVGLQRNKITLLPENIYSPVFGHLKVLNMDGNPIVCDCKIEWITKSPQQKALLGFCGDKSMIKKGAHFRTLTEEDFKYCHNY